MNVVNQVKLMKSIQNAGRRGAVIFSVLALAALSCLPVRAQDSAASATNNAEADKAWRVVNDATKAPAPPKEWEEKEPSHEDVAKYFGPFALKAADLAKDFYTRFPNHPKAVEAHAAEYRCLNMAVNAFGQTDQTARLTALEAERLKDPKLDDDERLQLRMGALRRLADGLPQTQDELEKAARALAKDFPKRDEPYSVLLMVAQQSSPEKSKALAKEIAESGAADQIKEEAQGILKTAELLGKPLNIKFSALDGRSVDVAGMKGKVVLVDFWATWCGPCVAELPHVKEAYEKLHPKGFEIVGISFDQSKEALEKFVAREKTEWPQYFDGEGWGNKYGAEFGIHAIPAMWLVDKQGNLRDVDGRDGLADKVAKLLAE